MDGIRKIARACYNGAAGTEKELAGKLFRSLDTNGDGKISLSEYKMLVHSSFSSDKIFKELDANNDGTLDFNEALALYYMNKVSVPRCSSCKSLLIHSYFSCLPCQAHVSYYLCCDCYGGGKFKHHHSSNEFLDTRAMLKLLDQILKKAHITTHQDDAEGVEKLKLEDEEDNDRDEGEEHDEDKNGEEEENGNGKKTKKKVKMQEGSKPRGRKREKIARAIDTLNMLVALGGMAVSTGAITVAATTCSIM